MQASEIELKFPVADPAAFQSLLSRARFSTLTPPAPSESNTLYDTPARDLRSRKHLLRLRQYGKLWTVTHKRPSETEDPITADAKYKVRIETETHVDDGQATAEIFSHLGYTPVFRYEKYRTEWSQMPLFAAERPDGAIGHLVVDETPLGNYAELEGPNRLDRSHVGVARHRFQDLPYRQLWKALRKLEISHRKRRRALNI